MELERTVLEAAHVVQSGQMFPVSENRVICSLDIACHEFMIGDRCSMI